ncbi:thaumatin [Lentinula raphanica]|nr:thaumatin [Lentinula raphanica]
MKSIQVIFFASSTLLELASARTFTVFNGCPFTMWPAMFTGVGTAPDFATGWEAAEFTSVTFTVPDNWQAGRIWGRRDCDFTTNPGPNSCLDGGCNGGLVCDPVTGTGVPPATLAEFTLSTNPSIPDNYDGQLLDFLFRWSRSILGISFPGRWVQLTYEVEFLFWMKLPELKTVFLMFSVTTNVNCPVASCPVDLGPNCPAPLIGPFDSTGFPVGCKSACDANLDGDPANSPNCCSGQFNTPATCPSSGVEFYSYFKDNCPDSYAYAFDESSGTALWTCDSTLAADYTVTFCPPPS